MCRSRPAITRARTTLCARVSIGPASARTPTDLCQRRSPRLRRGLAGAARLLEAGDQLLDVVDRERLVEAGPAGGQYRLVDVGRQHAAGHEREAIEHVGSDPL